MELKAEKKTWTESLVQKYKLSSSIVLPICDMFTLFNTSKQGSETSRVHSNDIFDLLHSLFYLIDALNTRNVMAKFYLIFYFYFYLLWLSQKLHLLTHFQHVLLPPISLSIKRTGQKTNKRTYLSCSKLRFPIVCSFIFFMLYDWVLISPLTIKASKVEILYPRCSHNTSE